MSKIEVNAVEPQSGTTLTLGASGDTVALAAGASQTGFGRQGAVNWDSTIRSSNFTAVSGNGYFCDTTAGSFTVTLPASPSEGDIVAVKDWSSTAATNNILIGRNGQKIEGNTTDGEINIHGDAQTLVFSGTSRGWMVVGSGLLEGIQNVQFVAATGGTVLTCGNFKTHIFTGPGSFVVSCAGNDLGSNSVEYLVVAGGGAGGTDIGGGGGAGGFRQNYPSPTIAGLPVTTTSYPITIGAGGASFPSHTRQIYNPGVNAFGNSGSNSVFSTITSAGGGGGGAYNGGAPAIPGTQSQATPGNSGGSGGGQGVDSFGPDVRTQPGTSGGTGNTPPVSPSQGNPGGTGWNSPWNSAGGGGAGAAGGNASSGSNTAGTGGIGSYWPNPLFGPTAPSYGTSGPVPGVRYFAGGGGGVTYGNSEPDAGTTQVAGGSGGGGSGGRRTPLTAGTAGTANTGGGGGGAGFNNCASPDVTASGAGGSGIVVIRYKYQ